MRCSRLTPRAATFSSDRQTRECARSIWRAGSVDAP